MKRKMRDEEREAAESVRVTDRRRINLEKLADDASRAENADRDETASATNLKPTYVEELETRTRAAEQKVADVQARFEQVRADLQREADATRVRLNRNADERARQEKADFIRALLPVMDNLRLAMNAAQSESGSLETLLDGLRGTINGFENALSSAGVERTTAIGARFDPELHEAVETIEVEPEQDGIVTAEFSSGYKINDRLLRPARVQVGRKSG